MTIASSSGFEQIEQEWQSKRFGELVEFTPMYDHVVEVMWQYHEGKRRSGPLIDALVYGRIHRRSQGDLGYCVESIPNMARGLGIKSITTIKDSLKRLAKEGFIFNRGKHPKYQTNIYSVYPQSLDDGRSLDDSGGVIRRLTPQSLDDSPPPPLDDSKDTSTKDTTKETINNNVVLSDSLESQVNKDSLNGNQQKIKDIKMDHYREYAKVMKASDVDRYARSLFENNVELQTIKNDEDIRRLSFQVDSERYEL